VDLSPTPHHPIEAWPARCPACGRCSCTLSVYLLGNHVFVECICSVLPEDNPGQSKYGLCQSSVTLKSSPRYKASSRKHHHGCSRELAEQPKREDDIYRHITEPVLNALKDPRKKGRCKPPKDAITPSAHLPIRAHQDFPKSIYYVYAKTCFRYYNIGGPDEGHEARTRAPNVSNAQLIQYVYHKSIKQNSRKVLLMKTGSTKQWNNMSYNMYCAQQSRVVRLFEGDTLFVEVSNAWMLDQEAEGTYFGAIKWGN
ncbi:hypothetical protein XENOCAPTIV_030289, partial [Xenoophorus captivus]